MLVFNSAPQGFATLQGNVTKKNGNAFNENFNVTSKFREMFFYEDRYDVTTKIHR
jgi:hypothetical protein